MTRKPGKHSRATERVRTQSEPSHAAGIADAVVIKDGGVFFVSERDGSVPHQKGHGLGLYFHDCRYLSGYTIAFWNVPPEPLSANGQDGFRSDFFLTNPAIAMRGAVLNRQRIGVRWQHVIDAGHHAMRDKLTVSNFDTKPHRVVLAIRLDADFMDVFAIRSQGPMPRGTLRPRRWNKRELTFAYDGRDRLTRALRVRFSRAPAWKDGGEARFEFSLSPQQSVDLLISFTIVESMQTSERVLTKDGDELVDAERAFTREATEWMAGFALVQSSSTTLACTLDRSLRDLRALRMTLADDRFFAAGVPWFVTLFGRDSLICALETLAYRPAIAADTLRLLARLQGRQEDSERDEEPGKIAHELRTGELARMGAIPYTPYYGTVDATPLFLIVLGEYLRWTADLALVEELHDPIERAIEWIDSYADHDGDGYVDYGSTAGARLVNQGWKDSGNAMVGANGRLAQPPIALVEVQGYVFLAKQHAAAIFERTGDRRRAERLHRQAAALQTRFNRDFWLPECGFYAMARAKGGRPLEVISSNPGQALWTGIISPDRRRRVAERLMADDMYSGWGIRTLSTEARAYNPVGYHLGTVWPHDNAIIAAGFRHCGFDEAACRIFAGVLDAASGFEHYRLPEVFAGFSRSEYPQPVHYPVACHPQAWAAGAAPFLLQAMLGLEPDAFNQRLDIVRPCLPNSVHDVRIERVTVGQARVDLQFERQPDGNIRVQTERIDGELTVRVVE
jgi:glycogen debranching enzyme